ncbi:MAG TPA: hypothetical protein PK048_00280 [Candidatus Absconditabacterales bacterium]|nr:hypothetical protein [Candidatus Absconditabacterales bacterium]
MKGIKHYLYGFLIIFLGGWGFFGLFLNYNDVCYANTGCGHNCSVSTNVSVTIYNSFTGILERGSATNQYISGGIIYVNTQLIQLIVGATDTTTYQLSGDILGIRTGAGSGNYSGGYSTILSSGEGIKQIGIEYMKGIESFIPPGLKLYLDQTPPTLPGYVFSNGQLMGSGASIMIPLSGGNYDSGVGFSGIILHIALDPLMMTEVMVSLSGNQIIFDSLSLPIGTLYRYIETIDYLGNSRSGTIQWFHHILPSIPLNGGQYIPQPLIPYYSGHQINNLPKDNESHIVDNNSNNNQSPTATYGKPIKKRLLQNFEDKAPWIERILPGVLPDTGVGLTIDDLHKVNNYILESLTGISQKNSIHQYTIWVGVIALLYYIIMNRRYILLTIKKNKKSSSKTGQINNKKL